MKHPPILCQNCGRAWPAPRWYTLHQRLALEASHCPACEATTLICADPSEVGVPTYAPNQTARRPTRFAPIHKPDDQAA